MSVQISVLVQAPAHSGIGGALSYEHSESLVPGTLVRVPLGKRETLGVVVAHEVSTEEPTPRHYARSRACCPTFHP